MSQSLVTVVTPSYNQGQFIRATIESVLNQGYENLEYIIMDGGSTDQTAAVVKDYASRLTWISERDRGQSHAINKGFRMAKGEVVAWLNSDDLFLPGAIERAARELQARPEVGAVYGEGYLIDREGVTTQRFPVTEPFNLWKLVHLSDYILQQTVFFRRKVFDEVGFVDEDLHYVMDWDLLIRIGKQYELGYIPEFMGCLREYPEAKTSAGGGRRIAEIARILRKHTGTRFPPGLIVYGLDTYRRIWCQAIDQRTPRLLKWPSRVLQWLIDQTCNHVIGRQICCSQGWYADGWAGKDINLMVPGTATRLIVQGHNPLPSSTRTALQIYSPQETFRQCCAMPGGDFKITIDLPERSGGARSVKVKAVGFGVRPPSPDGLTRYYRLESATCATAPVAGQQ